MELKDSNEKTIVVNEVGSTASIEELEFSTDVVLLDETKLEGAIFSSYTENGVSIDTSFDVKFVKVK